MNTSTQRSNTKGKDHKQNIPSLSFNNQSPWIVTKLGDISTIQDGTHSTPHYTEEGIPFFSVETITSNVAPKYISYEEHEKLIKRCKPNKNDILITRIGTLCESKIITWDYDFSIYVSLALISEIKILPEFLNQYIKTDYYKKEYIKRSLLLAVPQKINLKDLKETTVKYPSLEEQTKIANFLEAIDKKIELMEKKYKVIFELKKSLIKQLYPNMNESIPRLRFKNYDNSWNEIKIGEIGKITTGTTPKTKEKENYDKNGILWVTPGDISEDKYILDTERKLSSVGYKKGRSILKNSIFVTCIGIIGKKCINLEDCSCNQQINTITPNNYFDTSFIYYAIDKYMHNFEVLSGLSVTPIINKKDFTKTKIITPNLNEQKVISSFLSYFDKKLDMLKKEIKLNKKFKHSLLSKMFC